MTDEEILPVPTHSTSIPPGATPGDADVAPRAAVHLGPLLERQGDAEGARAAYQKAIDSVHADPGGLAGLIDDLRSAGADEKVTALLHRDPAAHVSLDDPSAVAGLLDSLWAVGAADQVTALADRAVAHTPLDDPGAVAGLLDSLRRVAADDQVTALTERLPEADTFELFRKQSG